MTRRTIDRALRWLPWGAGIAAFVWVLHRADLRGAFPVLAAAGPGSFFALLPLLGQIALDALAWRSLLGGLGHRVAWFRLPLADTVASVATRSWWPSAARS